MSSQRPSGEHQAHGAADNGPGQETMMGVTPFGVDLDALLAPVSANRPAGESLRYEGTYDRVREARREDDPNLSQGIYTTELKEADWDEVGRVCLDALKVKTKDVQIAAWLTEAWLHLYGFAGVTAGLQLLHGLCKVYWETLYPELDEELEYRSAPFVWMNEKLSISLSGVPITEPQSEDTPAYAWADWEAANYLEQTARQDARAVKAAESEGRPTRAKFLASVTLTPRRFYVGLASELNGAVWAVIALERILDEKAGRHSPSLVRFRETLLDIQHLVESILEEKAPQYTDYDSAEIGEGAADAEQEAAGGGSYMPIRSRDEAYRRLAEAADYLMRTEPHSPTPYLIKRAVSWGSMSLTELLAELVSSDQDLTTIYSLLGIRDLSVR